jgi:hypothetical protein
MKTKIMGFIFASFLSAFCQAQSTTPHKQYNYSYDANGNRIERDMQVVMLVPKVANPNQPADLRWGLSPVEMEKGATLDWQKAYAKSLPQPRHPAGYGYS